MRVSLGVMACLVSVGLAGCGETREAPKSAAFSGTWQAQFTLDESTGLPFATERKQVDGTISFDQAPATAPSTQPEPGPRAVVPGRFAIDFRPLGFVVEGSEAIAWHSTAPSLSIILKPQAERGNVAITGIQKDDRIDAKWQLLGESSTASGTVVLSRKKN